MAPNSINCYLERLVKDVQHVYKISGRNTYIIHPFLTPFYFASFIKLSPLIGFLRMKLSLTNDDCNI